MPPVPGITLPCLSAKLYVDSLCDTHTRLITTLIILHLKSKFKCKKKKIKNEVNLLTNCTLSTFPVNSTSMGQFIINSIVIAIMGNFWERNTQRGILLSISSSASGQQRVNQKKSGAIINNWLFSAMHCSYSIELNDAETNCFFS